MKRSTTLTALGVAGVLGLTGVAVAGAAGAATSAGTAAAVTDVRDRMAERIEAALSGLVDDGTITKEQAAEVARTLAEQRDRGPGSGMGPGMGEHMGMGHVGMGMGPLDLSVLTDVLGMSEDDLRSALAEDGASLASVAQEQGVAVEDVVAALQAAAEERIEEAVADGRITRERADQIIADLPGRLTAAVERQGHGPGRHGKGWRSR